MKKENLAGTVDDYISRFPASTQKLLQQMRKTIRAAAPMAEESISYGMPGYKLNKKPLVYFAGYDHHIGFYATPTGHEAFAKELSKYKQGKGSVQFPLDEALPLKLVTSIVKFRVAGSTAGNEKKVTAPAKKAASKKTAVKKKDEAAVVEEWLSKLDKEVRADIDAVRAIIKKAAPQLNERIKWNAPSYHCNGQDLLTFGPYKKDRLLLVFHNPVIVKIKSALLEGDYKDRRLVYFKNKKEAEQQKKELSGIIVAAMKLIGTGK